MSRLVRAYRDQSGSAAIEFALVGPLFIYLLIGLTVYGGWFWMAQGVQSLAAEGARAAVAGLDAAERDDLARTAIAERSPATGALDAERIDVQVMSNGSEVRVTVAYPADAHPLMALASLVPAPPRTITRVAAVRIGGY